MNQASGLLSPAHTDILSDFSPQDSLPTPRTRPLPAGSAKLKSLIFYLDDKILHVNRRYAKSFAEDPENKSPQAGYTDFIQVIADIDSLVDVVWTSATPSIQIQYLLLLAGYFRSYMHSFSFDTRSFVLARKFDMAFSTILQSANEDELNTTNKVRIRSLAQETRFEMIGVASKSGLNVEDSDSDDEPIFEDVTSNTGMAIDLETNHKEDTTSQSIALSLGKVYEKTLDILGGDLASLPPISVPESSMLDVGSFDL